MSRSPSLPALVVLLALSLPLPGLAAEVAGVQVPDSVTIGKATLPLHGAGVRKKVVFNVYVAALYAPAAGLSAEQLIADTRPRQMRLTLMRELDAQTLSDALDEGLRKNLDPGELSQLEGAIQEFTSLMRQAGPGKPGDVVQLDLDSQGVGILFRGQALGVVHHPRLAQALLKIWLGAHPAQQSLKQALLGRE